MKQCCYFRGFIALSLFTAMSLAPLAAPRAQDAVTGGFEGVVLDRAGLPIAGAIIQFIHRETGVAVAKRTDSQGKYRQGLLQPGVYVIRASKAGYVTQEHTVSLYATRMTDFPIRLVLESSSVPTASPAPTPTAVQPVAKISQSESARPSMVNSPGHYYALVIGNNNYQHLRGLKMAEADARAVASILKERFGFTAKLKLDATRQDILSEISNYRRTLEPDDNLLIYYAGHGYYDREVDRAYWLPVDARLEDNANWISADDITGNIRAVPGKHILVVSDSCYSGTISRDLGIAVSEPTGRERFLQRMMAGKSRTLMASGGNEPVSDGGGSGHSVFARAFLTALEQTEKDAFTATEAFRDFVQERVAGGGSQTPEYNPLRNSGHESGDFVFIRKRP